MPSFWKELLYIHRRGVMAYALFTLLSSLMSVFSLLMLIPFLRLLFYDINNKDKNIFFEQMFLQIISAHGKIRALTILCVIAAIIFFTKNIFRYLAQYVLAPIRSGIMGQLRNLMYINFLHKDILQIEKKEKGKVLSLFIQDVQEVEYGLIYFSEAIIKEPVILMVTLCTLFWMNWKLTAIALLMLLVSAAIIGKALRSLKIKSIALQQLQSSNTALISSTLQGFLVIRTMLSSDFFMAMFSAKQEKWRLLQNIFLQKKELASPLAEFLGICVVLSILCIGGIQVLQHEMMTPEVFITFIVVFSQIINPAKSLSNAISNLQKSKASWQEIQDFLATENIPNFKEKISISGFEEEICIENLALTIKDKNIFSKIQLSIRKGEHIGISGITGSGKSSFLKCIMGIIPFTSGNILIDGIAIDSIDTSSIWKIMNYIPQDGVIFPITIRENIALGREYDDMQWQKAIVTTGMVDVISNQNRGWDTIMDTEHLTLSGGERQRIALARALLMESPILIMDEATSALDKATEDMIFENISKYYPHLTIIGVTHRSQHSAFFSRWYGFSEI